MIQEIGRLRLRVNELEESEAQHQKEINVLRESAEKYQELLKNINDALFVSVLSDKTGSSYFMEVNDVACEKLGYTREELMKLDYFDIISPDQHKYLLKLRQLLIKSQHVPAYELTHITKDGRKIPVELSSRMFNLRGQNIVLTLARDISERNQTERALARSHRELRNLYKHVQSIREEERQSIALEIHDELGQIITALKFDLSWMKKRLPQEFGMLHDKIREMLELVDSSLATVTMIMTRLRPAILDDLGLVPAIEWQVEDFQKRTNIQCRPEIKISDQYLKPEVSTIIFRILQEALTNVARHASATMLKIKLKMDNGRIVMVLADNGIGIDRKAIRSSQSLGLIGMRERAYACGGQITVKRGAKNGTILTLHIPTKTSVSAS